MNRPLVNDNLDELEYGLANQLKNRAGAVPGGENSSAWDAIHERIRHRHHARQIRRAAGTVAAMMVLLAGLFSLVARNGTAGGGAVAPATQSPAVGEVGGLPHLVVGLPEYEINYASEYVPGVDQPEAPASIPADVPPPDIQGPSLGDLRLSVLTEPDRSYDGRVLFVTAVAQSVPYGFGEENPDAKQVEIGGNKGFLSRYTEMPAYSLGWRLPNGQGLHLVGLRLSEEELVTAGRALGLGPDGTVSWADGSMPAGMTLVRTTDTPVGPRRLAEVVASRNGGRMDLRLQQGDEGVLDDLIRDRAGAALEIGSTEVGGVPAVLSVYEMGNESTLLWMVRPGVVAELVATGSATVDLVAAASSLREIDDAEWVALIQKHGALNSPPMSGTSGVSPHPLDVPN